MVFIVFFFFSLEIQSLKDLYKHLSTSWECLIFLNPYFLVFKLLQLVLVEQVRFPNQFFVVVGYFNENFQYLFVFFSFHEI